GVEINDVLHPVGQLIDDAGNDHATVAVPDEYDIIEFLPENQVHDVRDVGVEIDVGAGEVNAFALPGQRDAVDGMSMRREQIADLLVFPATSPGSVDDHVGMFLFSTGAAVACE